MSQPSPNKGATLLCVAACIAILIYLTKLHRS